MREEASQEKKGRGRPCVGVTKGSAAGHGRGKMWIIYLCSNEAWVQRERREGEKIGEGWEGD